jgi:cytochrome c-type biogenesis protein CcmH
VIRILLLVVAALAFAPSALACNAHPTQAQLEGEVMCPVCGTTLDQSDSPAAQQIKRVIRDRIAAGDSDCRIKDRLVSSYGESILAAPRRSGFGLLAWWVPLGGILVAAAAVGYAAWRWSRRREPEAAFDPSLNGHGAIDPALERRLDEELARFDG